jgi:hypothetical protein
MPKITIKLPAKKKAPVAKTLGASAGAGEETEEAQAVVGGRGA